MKKGFTLIELLAVIVILAIILVIAVPKIFEAIKKSKDNIYISNEKMMVQAARIYTVTNTDSVPTNIGDTSVVYISDLLEQKLLKDIKSPEDKTTNCEGYILITKDANNNYEYAPYLKCGESHETSGYIDLSLSSVEVLVVAGGGSGGGQGLNDGSGGGGAGGLIYNSSYSVLPESSIAVSIGNGGAGVSAATLGNNGENTVFGTLTAIGGGGGGAEISGVRNGKNGGSGGGAGGYTPAAVGGVGTAGQGYKGGNNVMPTIPNKGGGGGGGAGSAGIDGGFGLANHESGGNGLYYGDKFGDNLGHNGWFAGGGGDGGGYAGYGGNSGIGGGGNGGNSATGQAAGISGITNTGGGGGGAGGSILGGLGNSGSGGSGIVIVRYLGVRKASGGIISSLNGYTIHTFTSGVSSFSTY